MKMTRYKENLRVIDDKVYSYDTHVANINHAKREVVDLGSWSVTTSKHINYVAKELNYVRIRP